MMRRSEGCSERLLLPVALCNESVSKYRKDVENPSLRCHHGRVVAGTAGFRGC